MLLKKLVYASSVVGLVLPSVVFSEGLYPNNSIGVCSSDEQGRILCPPTDRRIILDYDFTDPSDQPDGTRPEFQPEIARDTCEHGQPGNPCPAPDTPDCEGFGPGCGLTGGEPGIRRIILDDDFTDPSDQPDGTRPEFQPEIARDTCEHGQPGNPCPAPDTPDCEGFGPGCGLTGGEPGIRRIILDDDFTDPSDQPDGTRPEFQPEIARDECERQGCDVN